MKKIILLLLLITLLPPTTISHDNSLVQGHYIITYKRADFRTTLSHLLIHEGYYVNHPKDRGRETYAGISRRYNPNWWGWRFIDDYKKKNGNIKRYTHFPELDFWVLDYYLDIWVREGFYLLEDQQIANYVFDFRVNGTIGVRLIQKTLIELGQDISVNNKMDRATILTINSVNKKQFLESLRNRRILFYKNIAKNDVSQQEFLNHWLKRAKNI